MNHTTIVWLVGHSLYAAFARSPVISLPIGTLRRQVRHPIVALWGVRALWRVAGDLGDTDKPVVASSLAEGGWSYIVLVIAR